MSDTPRTIGVATIEVTGPATANVTQRVISVANSVVWIVKNSTDYSHTVCVTNFRPAFPKNGNFDGIFVLQQENCTGTVSPGGTGVIVGRFAGSAGQILSYDVMIDSTTAADPELEI